MGAPEGYQELVRHEAPALFRRALLLTHDWHLAEDLVQETAVTALTKWRRVRAADNPPGYLSTILTNHFLARTRKRSYHETPTEIEVPDTVDPWPGIDAEIEVAKGLACLAPNERAVIVARYLDDLPVGTVAEQLGRPESWVRVTAHRAIAKMRRQMSEPEPDATEGHTAAPSRHGLSRREMRED